MLNPIAGKNGSALAKKLSGIIENPKCYLSSDWCRTIKTAIGWLSGEEMSIDKTKLMDDLSNFCSPSGALISPIGLPELLSETISLLELPSVVPLSKKAFVKVDVSSWSVEDSFMVDHRPASSEEARFKLALHDVMSKHKVKDFYCPTMHPSHEGNVGTRQYYNQAYGDDFATHPGDGILFFHDNCKLFSDVDFRWWEKKAESFLSGNSRIGTENEYLVFCGFLIRSLIKEGLSVQEAWSAVCNNTPRLKNGVCGFKNLDDHWKIFAGSHSRLRDYCLGGGGGNPVAYFYAPNTCDSLQLYNGGGWIVCEKCPTGTVA